MPRSSQESVDWTLGLNELDGEPSALGDRPLRLRGPRPAMARSPNLGDIIPLAAREEDGSQPESGGSSRGMVLRSGPAASLPGPQRRWKAPRHGSRNPLRPRLCLSRPCGRPPTTGRPPRKRPGTSLQSWRARHGGAPRCDGRTRVRRGIPDARRSPLRSAAAPTARVHPRPHAWWTCWPSAPQRFYLSAHAAVGILRRASKRGRVLPPELDRALTSLARSSEPLASDTTRTSTPSSRPFGPTVRRLTPTECERLMSWPDGWTIVAGGQRARHEARRCGRQRSKQAPHRRLHQVPQRRRTRRPRTMDDGPRGPSRRLPSLPLLRNGVVSDVAEWIGLRLAEALR